MSGRASVLALMLLAPLAGCGPIPVDQAERSCVEDARAATGPRGEIAMGIGTDGHRSWPSGSVSVSVSSDYIMGRDPSDVFNNCVMRRSGQMPTRMLTDMPGWKR